MMNVETCHASENVVLIWHSCYLADYCVEQYGWHLINNQECFEKINFSQFTQVVLLVELSWTTDRPIQMKGLELCLKLLPQVDLRKTPI